MVGRALPVCACLNFDVWGKRVGALLPTTSKEPFALSPSKDRAVLFLTKPYASRSLPLHASTGSARTVPRISMEEPFAQALLMK